MNDYRSYASKFREVSPIDIELVIACCRFRVRMYDPLVIRGINSYFGRKIKIAVFVYKYLGFCHRPYCACGVNGKRGFYGNLAVILFGYFLNLRPECRF